MATVPQQLLNALQEVKGFNKTAFMQAHASGAQVTSIRINPAKETMLPPSFTISKVPWSEYGFYLAQRPSFTFDPLFHAGCYYVQEASSMFVEQALRQTVDLQQPLRVLDLCAAPGGKTTHLQSLLSADSLLVSNDVIKSRVNTLKQNIIKWGSRNVVITNNDPQHFKKLESFFDVIVVDAPCSGSGLFRKDADAIAEWSPENVQLCSGRQKRILSDVLPALKKDGILIYATCSYSKEENEDIADWLVTEPAMESVPLRIENEWNIVETSTAARGYRFFPDKVQGEGFYMAVFKKSVGTEPTRLKAATLELASARETAVVQNWVNNENLQFFTFPYIYGLLKMFVPDYSIIKKYLNVQYAGVGMGTLIKDKLLPEHALALSTVVAASVPVATVDNETAIRYLQRAEITIEAAEKGWQIIAYNGCNLGWINVLQNRINNYYPKEMRILKQYPNQRFEK